MNNWRRNRGEFHHGEIQVTRSQHRKPPQCSWQPTIPSWEKQFCYSVGTIPWQKLLDMKRFSYLYDNVIQWDDSAGEEAFRNAKNRFWAKINSLPCDISLPDPDIYIDEVDWNSSIDQELLLDLEREPEDLDQSNEGEEEVVILGKTLLLNQSFSCTGWGDAEEVFQKAAEKALDPGHENLFQNAGNYENLWENNYTGTRRPLKDNGWGNCRNNWSGRKNKYTGWRKVKSGTEGDSGTRDGNTQKSEGGGRYMSRYKTSRFHDDDYRMDRGWWRNGRRG